MTIVTRTAAIIAFSTLTLSGATAQEPAALKAEMDRLRGTFTMLSGQADGQDMPAAIASTMKRVAKDSITTVTIAGQLYFEAVFRINPSAAPKTIDYDMKGGLTAGQKQLGLYRMSGDTVTFCFGSPGKPRPTEFKSAPGSGVTCSVWKREKPPS